MRQERPKLDANLCQVTINSILVTAKRAENLPQGLEEKEGTKAVFRSAPDPQSALDIAYKTTVL